MEAADTNQPALQKLSKMKVSYHSLLLWGINDVRVGVANRLSNTDSRLNSLITILPPELRPDVDKFLAGSIQNYNQQAHSIMFQKMYRPTWTTSEDKDIYEDDYLKLSPSERSSYCVNREIYRYGRNDMTPSVLTYSAFLKHIANVLAHIIEVLDNAGLMREFRREEIGGL